MHSMQICHVRWHLNFFLMKISIRVREFKKITLFDLNNKVKNTFFGHFKKKISFLLLKKLLYFQSFKVIFRFWYIKLSVMKVDHEFQKLIFIAGIKCPRTSIRSLNTNNASQQPAGEPFAEEALKYVREKCMQREVTIKIESIDKVGNFIGWLWVDEKNLSVSQILQI